MNKMKTVQDYRSSGAQQLVSMARNLARAIEKDDRQAMVRWALSGYHWLSQITEYNDAYGLDTPDEYEHRANHLSGHIARWFGNDGPDEPFGALIVSYLEMLVRDLQAAAETVEAIDSHK